MQRIPETARELEGRGRAETMENYIEKIASGDTQALALLYEETKTAVYGYALSILRNPAEAEDVFQEVYLQIYDGAESYVAQGKPMAWIFTITRNLSLMSLRRQKRTLPLSPEEWQELFAEEETEDVADRLLLSVLLEQLGEEEREIVMLHALSGLKHREIAQLMGLGLSTVLSRYSRAIKKLRRAQEGGAGI